LYNAVVLVLEEHKAASEIVGGVWPTSTYLPVTALYIHTFCVEQGLGYLKDTHHQEGLPFGSFRLTECLVRLCFPKMVAENKTKWKISWSVGKNLMRKQG
jgi:hypothetical protein